ncbi:hypothetical protein SDJN03_18705, partial [Cucurbita argyrosperma subsp. sororia]
MSSRKSGPSIDRGSQRHQQVASETPSIELKEAQEKMNKDPDRMFVWLSQSLSRPCIESQEENVTKAGGRKTYRRSAVPLMNVDRKGIGLSSSSFFESLKFVDGFKGEIQEVGLVFTDTISGRTFFSNSSVFPELPVFELHSSIDRWSFHFTLPCKSSIFPTG